MAGIRIFVLNSSQAVHDMQPLGVSNIFTTSLSVDEMDAELKALASYCCV